MRPPRVPAWDGRWRDSSIRSSLCSLKGSRFAAWKVALVYFVLRQRASDRGRNLQEVVVEIEVVVTWLQHRPDLPHGIEAVRCVQPAHLVLRVVSHAQFECRFSLRPLQYQLV